MRDPLNHIQVFIFNFNPVNFIATLLSLSDLSLYISLQMASTTTKEIVTEVPTLLRVYKDGTVERFKKIQIVPPSAADDHQKTGPVSSKDIAISENPFIAARLYIQQKQRDSRDRRIPILVYFHGGGFISESAFSPAYHSHFNEFVSLVDVMVVSVEYRLAPEHLLPAAYNDCWTVLKWVASHSSTHSQTNSDIDAHNTAIQISTTSNEICRLYDTPPYFKNLEYSSNTERWLINYGDFDNVFMGGDSAGGNIVHNVAMRAGSEALQGGGVRITGAIYSHPYFYGSDLDPVESLPETWKGKNYYVSTWNLVYPTAPGGIDNPMVNPTGPGAPSLAGLGCEKILVCVAGKDKLRDRGVGYYEGVKKSGWKGNLELFEEEEEDHIYHIHKSQSENSYKMIKRLSEFLLQ